MENVQLSSLGDLDRDPDTIAAAPEMPVDLIEPQSSDADTGETTAWGIDATGASASRFDGASASVAVLDTGLDAAHPAFTGVRVEDRDFTGSGPGDQNGHGTHCAGTILGRDVDGRIGVARGVDRLIVGKILDAKGRGSAENVYKAMLWAAESGANIISMSLGFAPAKLAKRLRDDGWPEEAALSAAIQSYGRNLRLFDAIMGQFRARRSSGGEPLVVAASGNDSLRARDPRFRIAASMPSAAQDVISVGALRQTGAGLAIASFSNSQPTLSAPGVGVMSAWPGGGVKSLQGTSMACPHVAGLAALWWQSLEPRASAEIVRAKLLANTDFQPLAPGYDHTDVGYGLAKAP